MADQLLQSVARPTAPSYTARIPMDGRRFVFGVAYNSRSQRWLWWLLTSNGSPLIAGVELVIGVDLLAPISDPRKPAGQLFAVDTGGEGKAPGRLDLRGRVQVIYRPAADVETLADTIYQVR